MMINFVEMIHNMTLKGYTKKNELWLKYQRCNSHTSVKYEGEQRLPNCPVCNTVTEWSYNRVQLDELENAMIKAKYHYMTVTLQEGGIHKV